MHRWRLRIQINPVSLQAKSAGKIAVVPNVDPRYTTALWSGR
jgi:hypothetical protein